MATESNKIICSTCNRKTRTYICEGCSERFCFTHLLAHRKHLDEQLDQLGNNHDRLRQDLNDQSLDPTKYPSIKRINQWEKDSIEKIQRTANHYRDKLMNYTCQSFGRMKKRLNDLAEQIKKIRNENEFNEIDLNDLKEKFERLENEFTQLPDVVIEHRSTALIDHISVRAPFRQGTCIFSAYSLLQCSCF